MPWAVAYTGEDDLSENSPMIFAALGVLFSGVLCITALASAAFLTMFVALTIGTGEFFWFLPIAALLYVAALLPFWAIRIFWKANASLPANEASALRASAQKLRKWGAGLLALWLAGFGFSAFRFGATGEEFGWTVLILLIAGTPLLLLGGLLNNPHSPIGPQFEKAD